MTRNIWIGIVVIIVLVAGGWWYLNQSSTPALPETTQLPTTRNTNTVSQTATNPAPVQQAPKTTTQPTPTPAPVMESAKIISCNPRGYDSTYFQQEKPCVSDMTAVDIERENKALSIIGKASAGNTSKYCPLPQLYASDKRYSVVMTNCAPKSGYVVVDLVSEKVTDFFTVSSWTGIEHTSKRIVFLEPIVSNQQTIGEKVRWFIFGTEKSNTATGSELFWPQSYLHIEGPNGAGSVSIVASSESSITLGINDRNKSSVQSDSTVYEQTGTKVISF